MEKSDENTGEVFELGIDGRHDADGRERLDPRPHVVNVKVRAIDHQLDAMRRIIREEVSRAAQANDLETFDEANDFEVEGDYDPSSEYEEQVEGELDGFKQFRKDVFDAAVELVRGRKSPPPPPPAPPSDAPPDAPVTPGQGS